MTEFNPFPKITRFWEQDIVVTEKIDGTNGIIHIGANDEFLTGSRNKWITPDDDNYGFSRWAHDNRDELCELLGHGTHYGEWWGQSIQRRYNMDKKVFSLFNTRRWGDLFDAEPNQLICDCVPLLFTGTASAFFEWSKEYKPTSKAAKKYGKDFTNAEGYMMYFSKLGEYMKVPLNK